MASNSKYAYHRYLRSSCEGRAENEFTLEILRRVWPCQYFDFDPVILISYYDPKNYSKINLYCLSHQVSGKLLQFSCKTNIDRMVILSLNTSHNYSFIQSHSFTQKLVSFEFTVWCLKTEKWISSMKYDKGCTEGMNIRLGPPREGEN